MTSILDRLLSRISLDGKDVISAIRDGAHFVENEHPRANNGEFTNGVGGGRAAASSTASSTAASTAASTTSSTSVHAPGGASTAQVQSMSRIERTMKNVTEGRKTRNRSVAQSITSSRASNGDVSMRFAHGYGSPEAAKNHAAILQQAYENSARAVSTPSEINTNRVQTTVRGRRVWVNILIPGANSAPTNNDWVANLFAAHPANPSSSTPATPAAPAIPRAVRARATQLVLDTTEVIKHARLAKGSLSTPADLRVTALNDTDLKLELAKENITFTRPYGSPKTDRQCCKEFEALTGGVCPVAYKKYVMSDLAKLPGGIKSYVMNYDISGNTMSANAVIQTNDARIRLSRTYDFHTGKVEHAYQRIISVNPALTDAQVQGGGKCAAMFGKSMDMYDSMGIKKIHVHANIDVGGYAWVRYGFVPDVLSWPRLKERAKLKSSRYPPDIRAAVLRAIDNPDPKYARVLASIKTPSGKIKDGKAVPIGKDILVDSDWYGTINLEDESNYSLTRSYMARERR